MNIKILVLALVVGLFVVGVATAADQKTQDKQSPPVGQSGIKIHVDPATGEWIQTPVSSEQKRSAVTAPAAEVSKVTSMTHADGSIEYRMNGQFMQSIVAKRGADGKLKIVCSEHGLEHAHAKTPAPAKGMSDER